MPVLKIVLDRFQRMTGLPSEKILDRLPYLGLDIEGVDQDSVRIEYNPNRPDFSTDYGVARALRGLVGKELGVPRYRVTKGRVQVFTDGTLAKIRPFISCAIARGLKLDDETIRQIISMQEDLHNGLGRKRKKVAIGLHNLAKVKPPVYYSRKGGGFSFTPLGSSKPMTVSEILESTETGRAYGHILAGAKGYPMLFDSKATVLSFPPIINGADTKVDTSVQDLFIDITSTDMRLGDEALAIVCAALSDAGAGLESVVVSYGKRKVTTPDMQPQKMRFDTTLAERITGLALARSQMRLCLRKARLDLDANRFAVIPRYRVDILHPVDLAEEVAIGFGLDRIAPQYPPSHEPGRFNPAIASMERMATSMTQAGFVETMGYDLTDEATLYGKFSRPSESRIEVDNPRSMEHYLLRDSLIPTLMAVLGRNVKSEYPQRIFEIGRVFTRKDDDGTAVDVREAFSLAALVAHSSSSFTEAKMYVESFVRRHLRADLEAVPAAHWAFADGRCAELRLRGSTVGHVGEVRPLALAEFGVGVPAAGFEIDLGLVP